MAIDAKRFNWRAFFSLYVVISFIVITITGIVLFVSPPGRVANWSEWTLGGLTKEQWQAVHTTFTFLFVVAAAFHVYFNWKILLSYLKHRMHQGVPRKRELVWASALATVLLVLTIGDVPPVGYVMDASVSLSTSWSSDATEPPVPHAELLTLAKLAETVPLPVEKIRAKLDAAGLDSGAPDATLGDIASANGLRPSDLYAAIMAGEREPVIPIAEGGGYGQKSVRQVSDQLNVPVDAALENLRRGGISADAEANVRELATAHGRLPIELVKLMAGSSE
jgi:hypothetical protein